MDEVIMALLLFAGGCFLFIFLIDLIIRMFGGEPNLASIREDRRAEREREREARIISLYEELLANDIDQKASQAKHEMDLVRSRYWQNRQ